LTTATCDGGTQSDQDFTAATGAGSFKCTFADGPATHNVSVTVADSDLASDSHAVSVTVSNVAPTIQTVSLGTPDPVTGDTTLRATFTDPGADGYTGSFQLTYWDGVSTNSVAVSSSAASLSGPGAYGMASPAQMTQTVRLPRGCYSYTLTATVNDDDAGTDTETVLPSTVDVYQASFKDPIRGNERNIAKYGNVVPVKALLTSSCSGAAVTTPELYLMIAEGVGPGLADDSVSDTNIVVESVSNADTGNKMRVSSGMYIYNLSTKGLKTGTDYTLRVRLGSNSGPIILKALFQPKK
jgi:hypothetical protein